MVHRVPLFKCIFHRTPELLLVFLHPDSYGRALLGSTLIGLVLHVGEKKGLVTLGIRASGGRDQVKGPLLY